MDDGLGGLDFLKADASFSEDRPGSTPSEDSDDGAGVIPAQPTAGPAPASTPSAAPAAATPAAPAATVPASATTPTLEPAAPAVAATPPAEPAQTPAAAPAAPAQPAVAAPAAAPAQPGQDYGTWRQGALKTLAEGPFALSEETAAALQDDPAKVLPTLAANVYLMAVENATAAVRELLPNVVPQMMEQRQTMAKAVESFNEAAPDLAPHLERVVPISNFLRSQNPDMPTDKFIPLVVATARQMLGLTPPAAAAPAAPAKPATSPIPPHTPVVASAPRAGTPAVQSQNPWAALAGERGTVSTQDGDEDD